MNRHGDGRPSNARWYQSMARSTTRAALDGVVGHGATVGSSGTRASLVTSDVDVRGGRGPGCSWPAPATRRHVPARPQVRRRSSSSARANGAVPDCGSRRCPPSGRWHSRRGVDGAWDPATWCTTPATSEHAFLRRECGGTRRSRGCGRSHRQLVAALQPTCLEHGATRTGRHAGAEAVLRGTASVVGLVGALHAILLIGPHRPSLSGASLIAACASGSTSDGNRHQGAPRVSQQDNPQVPGRDNVPVCLWTTDEDADGSVDTLVPAGYVVHILWTYLWTTGTETVRRCR